MAVPWAAARPSRLLPPSLGVFVELVLRYGPPTGRLAELLQPRKGFGLETVA